MSEVMADTAACSTSQLEMKKVEAPASALSVGAVGGHHQSIAATNGAFRMAC